MRHVNSYKLFTFIFFPIEYMILFEKLTLCNVRFPVIIQFERFEFPDISVFSQMMEFSTVEPVEMVTFSEKEFNAESFCM